MTWLLDTLVWTGALIMAVLVLRRPVARHFGARTAYALWFVPIVRLALPPVVLPAWLAPQQATLPTTDAVMLTVPVDAAPATAAAMWIDWGAAAITVWLAGAAIYALSRIVSYHQLRRELLAHARPVGCAGPIRLLETPATASPLAFGVFDKVIALPPGFMAATDRRARDLALAHELAHHRAHDLALNFLALPLFALHWFNPLALLGWRAMRRDQEAACDARVVERCDRVDRATYAALIASTVAGPRGALAAPMACPVLGDKSIVHRLRNLTMTTPSIRRRRTGALLIGATSLLVPLTASVSYARDDAEAITAPPAAPLAPRAPDQPLAPVDPTAPEAPPAPGEPGMFMVEHTSADGSRRERQVVVVRDGRGQRVSDQGTRPSRQYRVIRLDKGEGDEAFEARMKSLEERLSHLDRTIMPPAEIARITARAESAARVAVAAAPRAPVVVMNCDGAGVTSETTSADGNRVIRICQRHAMTDAARSLRAARSEVARTREMSADVRAQVLNTLDREIERMEDSD